MTRLVDDPRLCSVLGIAVDAERGQLWAVNADLGASTRPSAAGPKHLAAVGFRLPPLKKSDFTAAQAKDAARASEVKSTLLLRHLA
ncbi:MAG: hypothetical protein ABI488_07210 [Polyangiaceae bacterium]